MPPLRRSELAEFADRSEEALRVSHDDFAGFLEAVGVENLRVRRANGALVAGAGVIPTEQRVGGAWVASGLVTAVWVAPAARGRGAASALMAELLEEMRAAGAPLSTLYPANLALYRRAGYEVAGAGHWLRCPTAALPAGTPDGWTVEELRVSPRDPGVLAEVYEAALPSLGTLATRRVHALWHAMMRWNRGGRTVAFAARDPGGAARGSLVLDTLHSDAVVHVRELIAHEPDAARTLLALLAGYRGVFTAVEWVGGPFDPFAALLADWPERIETEPAMVRLVDVPAALRARGYPPGVTARVALEVADPVLPANAGRLVLALDGTGAAEVERGGDGRVRAGVRGLAALYTGYATPRELALAGLLDGPAADLDALAAAFAGPRPWIADRI